MAHQLREFEKLEKLGEGAYSSVYKVKRLSDGKIYALKRVMLSTLSEQEKQNALNEVRIIASVRHPNIVNFKQCFIDPHSDCLCIIMEYVDNGDLLSHINRHIKNGTYFQEEEIWNALIQVIKGLQSLHQLSIYHRDLKSANVFMNKDGSIKLGDFNVSKICKQGLLYTQTGTPYYASPEVWRDLPYDSKADIWSVGCIIYEMCTLKPPFRAEDMPSLFKKVVKGKIEFKNDIYSKQILQKGQYQKIPSFYSQQLSLVLRSMLQVSPHLRPNCKKILSDEVVQQHMNEKHLEEPDEQEKSILISTIKFPQNFKSKSYKIEFPKPNYQPVKIRKRISSNTRLMTTFDQNDSIHQYTNKSMMEESSNRVQTEACSNQQQAISYGNHSQRQISSICGIDGKISSLLGIDTNNHHDTEQIISRQQYTSNLLAQKGNKELQGERQSMQLSRRVKQDSSSVSLNPHINYIQHLDRISNIELSDQLLASAQTKKHSVHQHPIQYQNGSAMNQQVSALGYQLQDSILQSNHVSYADNQNTIPMHDNSKNFQLAELDRKIAQKQSVSTNENRRKSNNSRQSSSLSSQVQPKNYYQINKQKQLYKILNHPAHLISMQKGGYQLPSQLNNQSSHNNSSILNQSNNSNQQNISNLNNESISKALRDSLIALEKDIKSTRAQRASIKHQDSLEGVCTKLDSNKSSNEQITNPYRSHKNSSYIPSEGSRNHQDTLPQTSSIQATQKSYRDRVNYSNKENMIDLQENSQIQSSYSNTKNIMQQLFEMNNDLEKDFIKDKNYIQLNRNSIHIPSKQNNTSNQNKIQTLTELEKSPIAAQNAYEPRKKSKSIFERNNTILTMPDTYINSEFTKENIRERVLQNTTRKNGENKENTEAQMIKKNYVKQNNQNHNIQGDDQHQKLLILPVINSIKSTKGDRSVSVQKKFSPVHSSNNRHNSLNRNGYNILDQEIKRKVYQDKDYKLVDISDLSQKYNIHNLYKQNYSHNKHSYQQTPMGQDKNNISFDQDSINNYKRIHSNSLKPAHKNSLSPNNNRNVLQKLL